MKPRFGYAIALLILALAIGKIVWESREQDKSQAEWNSRRTK